MHLKRGLCLAGSALALALVACEPSGNSSRELAAADDMPGTSAKIGRAAH